MYININLSKELQFGGKYYTLKIENGQGCEITLSPLEGHEIVSSEGYLLEKIQLIVEVINNDNPNQVNYKITSKSSYKGVNKEGNMVSLTQQSKREGSLQNPAIDLTQKPIFFTINDACNSGVIAFKNSFPYSNMEF